MEMGMETDVDDAARVAALQDYGILDTAEDAVFDAITSLVSRLLDVPISLVSLVDHERQWFKSNHGIGVRETPRSVSICHHAIKGDDLFIVPDASLDERFASNPLVTDEPHVRFYAGMPLRTPDGFGLGTLCAIDLKPRELSAAEQRILTDLAALASSALETHRRTVAVARCQEEQEEQQEQKELLASMIVHDLRSPLGAIILSASWGSSVSKSLELENTFSEILHASERMQALIGDVLDICLGESGKLVPRVTEFDLVQLARVKIAEQERSTKARNLSLSLGEAPKLCLVQGDPMLIGRVLTNLLDNAVKFSPDDSAVLVELRVKDGMIELSVADEAELISPSDAVLIFEAHRQGVDASPGSGYGLGLAFCRLAVEVHGGTIFVEPRSVAGNRFVVRLPALYETPSDL